MLPQFARKTAGRFSQTSFSIGLTIFVIGLSKKVLIADQMATIASPIFDQAAAGHAPDLVGGWKAMLAYSFQLYFDFSGYSDMAIGLGRMFGIRLPLNFNSPYKAASISDFWRRWHMTLSQFLRDYLYIPLGGNRKGNVRRYVNLMVTMVLGGLWHGAGFTFIFWGFLHGLYLCVDHAFKKLRRDVLGHDLRRETRLGRTLGTLATFFFAAIAWVFFRAETFSAAWLVLGGVFGLHGVEFSLAAEFTALVSLAVVGLIVWGAPNTQELLARVQCAWNDRKYSKQELEDQWIAWQPSVPWAVAVSLAFVACILGLSQMSEFIYYQF
jgi:D-alanyl-lipoteichoic acid acyltransferase DltB (MBOAT superfamily)